MKALIAFDPCLCDVIATLSSLYCGDAILLKAAGTAKVPLKCVLPCLYFYTNLFHLVNFDLKWELKFP